MYAFGFDDANGETPESGDVFRAVASAYAAAIFIVVPIDNIVAAVLDAPVTAVDVKKTLGIGLIRGSAGDTVRDFDGLFAGLFLYGVPFDDESLSDMGKIEILVEFVCGPDLADFDPAMIRGCIINEIRPLALQEVQFDVLKECGLVPFDGEVIMGLTLQDQVVGDLALSQ